MSRAKIEDLAGYLSQISQMSHTDCVAALKSLPGIARPEGLRTPTLRRLLAYEVQVQTIGGLGRADRHALKAAMKDKPEERTKLSYASPGMHLVREWNGRTFRVEVKEEGYVLDGKRYRSLSAVARHITGAAWSGPRFFGLKKKQSK